MKQNISYCLAFFLLLCMSSPTSAQLGKFTNKLKQTSNKIGRKVSTSQQSSSTKENTPSQEVTGLGEEAPKEYYVSRNTGRGRLATKEQPAKDLGNIIALLKPGDIIHIAEGEYTSRGDQSADELNVPVSIIGGYDPTFSIRDPWGKHQTIFTGIQTLDALTAPRLYIRTNQTYKAYEGEIVIDGLIVDHGARNRYKDEKELMIVRTGSPKLNQNPTPSSGGIRVLTGKYTNVIIRNCIVMNTAPQEGALSVQAGENAQVIIQNNLLINNTGNGIQCLTAWYPRDGRGKPKFQVLNNSVLFTWKPDAIASHSGNALMLDAEIELIAAGNVFGFSDRGGIDNIKKCKTITLKDNLIVANKKFDYREWNTKMRIDEIEDESDLMSYESTGNISQLIKVPVSEAWAAIYAGRKEISRADVDAQANAANSDANALRGMLGLPTQANSVSLDAAVWLHRLYIKDAIPTGLRPYLGKYGSRNPQEMKE